MRAPSTVSAPTSYFAKFGAARAASHATGAPFTLTPSQELPTSCPPPARAVASAAVQAPSSAARMSVAFVTVSRAGSFQPGSASLRAA